MSKRSGTTTTRNVVASDYKGFDIIKVSVKRHEWSHFTHSYTDWGRTEVHYDFCPIGCVKKPSTHYEVYANNVADCKACVDKHISGEEIYFTSGEREKYIYAPNRKNSWGFNYESLMKLMREHKKGDKRMKLLLEDRLTDANYHSYCGLICQGKYNEFEQMAADELTKNEKFEVYTETKRRRIKDPESLVDGLKKVLEDYLQAQGIKDTSVKVRFIKDW